ncbi:MAG: hypothetical protein ACRDG3_11725, partial [Tepidiformaceae bacterium]
PQGAAPVRRAFPRSTDVVSLIDLFMMSAISSLMLVRLYLFVAGYPQVGGGGLHIAHMIWGALLMLIALLVAVSFVSTASTWWTAVIGGLGFGLLVDETGKFLTSDSNYFFKPAAALIYVLFISIFLFSRTIARRRGFTSQEYVDNALDALKGATGGELDELQRKKVLGYLRQAGPSDVATRLRELVEQLPVMGTPSPAARFRRNLEVRYARIAKRRGFARVVGSVVLLGAVISCLEILVILLVDHSGWSGRPEDLTTGIEHFVRALNVVAWLEFGAGASAVGLAVLGVVMGAARPRGLRMLERAIFVEILLVQPFAFYEAQFFASAGLLLGLPLLAAVQYVLRRQTGAEDDALAARRVGDESHAVAGDAVGPSREPVRPR